MIDVSLSNSVDAATRNVVAAEVLALIDTGADACRIDTHLANEYKLKKVGEVASVSDAGSVMASRFIGHIVFSDGFAFHTVMLGSPFRENGFHHRLLIGMEALQHFELLVNRKESKVVLSRKR